MDACMYTHTRPDVRRITNKDLLYCTGTLLNTLCSPIWEKNLKKNENIYLYNWRDQELNSLLLRVKEEALKAGLKLNIQKTKIMASSPITSWHTDGGKVETMTDFIF